MSFKFSFTLILVTLCFTLLKADDPFKDPYTYLNENGLDMYLEPSIHSEVVEELQFGDILFPDYDKSHNYTTLLDTVNNVSGKWAFMRKNDKKGFIFSPYAYITYNNKLVKDISENDFRITKEGLCFGEMDYHPDLKWYGFYYESNQFYLKKINVSMHLSTVEDPTFFQKYDCANGKSIVLKSDYPKRSLFLVGSLNELSEGDVPYIYFNNQTGYDKDTGFLYPEQTIELNFKGASNYLRAYESVIVDSSYSYVKNYQLEFAINDSNDQAEHSLTNLSKLLGLYGDAKKHSRYLTPKLYWAGDLNHDDAIDLIIFQHGMVNHGGTFWSHTLFLSKIVNGKIIMENIDSAKRDSCF